MPIEGTVSKEGDLYKDFTAGILKPGQDKHFLSPIEIKIKKALAKIKKEKMTPKGGKKSKRNIKMARKFRNKRRRGGVFATRVQFLSNDEKKQIKEAMDTIGKDDAYGETSNALRQRIMDKINPRNANGERNKNHFTHTKTDAVLDAIKGWKREMGICEGTYYSPCKGGSRRRRRRRTKKRKSRRRKKRTRRRRRKKR